MTRTQARRKARQNAKRNKAILQWAGVAALAIPLTLASGALFGAILFQAGRNLGLN